MNTFSDQHIFAREIERKAAIARAIRLIGKLDDNPANHGFMCPVGLWNGSAERPSCTCEFGTTLSELERVK